MYDPAECGDEIARRRHLWVAWALELVGDVAWTREIAERRGATFAAQDATLDEMVGRYRVSRVAMDQTGMGEKPVEDAQRRYGTSRVEGVQMSNARRLDLATALKQRFEDRTIRIPRGDRALRADLHAVKKVAGPTGHPRLEVDGDGEASGGGHADRFWAAALAAGACAGGAARYALHRIDNHRDGSRDRRPLDHRTGRGWRWRGQGGGLA